MTKAQAWAYEEEYRLVGIPSLSGTYLDLVDQDYLRLPRGALLTIIVGCNADYDAICAVARKHAPDLPVKRAVRSPNQYRLVIEG